jgi:hypothetical protein
MAFLFYLPSLLFSHFFSMLLQKTRFTNLQVLQESLAGFWLADRSNPHTQPVRSISAASTKLSVMSLNVVFTSSDLLLV